MRGHLAHHGLAAAPPGQSPRPRRPASLPRISSCSTAPPATRTCGELLGEQRPAPEVSLRPGDAPRRAALLVGHDRHPQGRHAHAPQPGRERRAVPPEHRPARADRVLAVLPFFHIYGMTVLLNLALRQRASLVTMPKFDLVELAIRRFEI